MKLTGNNFQPGEEDKIDIAAQCPVQVLNVSTWCAASLTPRSDNNPGLNNPVVIKMTFNDRGKKPEFILNEIRKGVVGAGIVLYTARCKTEWIND